MDSIGWVMILLGAAIFAFGIWRYRVALAKSERAAGTWRQVQGTLHEASVREEVTWDSQSDRVTEYHPAVRYTYQAGGRDHEGTRAFLSRVKFDGSKDAQAWQARVKPGPIAVWHDPSDPAQSVLEVDRPTKAAIFIAGMFAVILIGVGISML